MSFRVTISSATQTPTSDIWLRMSDQEESATRGSTKMSSRVAIVSPTTDCRTSPHPNLRVGSKSSVAWIVTRRPPGVGRAGTSGCAQPTGYDLVLSAGAREYLPRSATGPVLNNPVHDTRGTAQSREDKVRPSGPAVRKGSWVPGATLI